MSVAHDNDCGLNRAFHYEPCCCDCSRRKRLIDQAVQRWSHTDRDALWFYYRRPDMLNKFDWGAIRAEFARLSALDQIPEAP